MMKRGYIVNLLVYNRAWIRQIKFKANMTKEGSTKMVNFITIGAGGLVLGRGYISHYSKYALSSTLSIYITLIAIVFREYNAFPMPLLISIVFYDGAADMPI